MSLVAGLLKTGPCLVLSDFYKTNLPTGILKQRVEKRDGVVAQILSLQVKTF